MLLFSQALRFVLGGLMMTGLALFILWRLDFPEATEFRKVGWVLLAVGPALFVAGLIMIPLGRRSRRG